MTISRHHRPRLAWLFFLLVHACRLADLQAAPVKVFILAGQSNMEGQAVADLDGKDYNDGKGTLRRLLADPAKAARFPGLRTTEGDWAVRDDVWVRYQPENESVKLGPLGLGFTVYGGRHHYGPELQFGRVLGDFFTNQVLLLKTAWGGKSLYRDFRPPSSGGEVGPYYRKMLAEIREGLSRLPQEFPSGRGEGYELAGFVWYQGWNDGCEPKTAVPEYERNLVNLIRDLRRELAVPNLPVVIGELTGPWVKAKGEWAELRRAQAGAAAHKEFAGTVQFVETHEFVRPAEESPCPGHGHHEFANAETYLLVGDALGQGLKRLLEAPAAPSGPAKPAGHVGQSVEGWTVQVDNRLLDGSDRELGARALRLLANRLFDIRLVLPADQVARLQQVPIWLDRTHGGLRSAQYHPSAGWLKAHGYDEALARCVHIPDAAEFASLGHQRVQPWSVLHELAHAYHDQVLGFEHAELQAAWEKFRDGGRYRHALHIDGGPVPHYALTDPKEFFAEMTEAFFGVNDFFPFNRAELKREEPRLFELLETLWGTRARP